jgi:hypothetical protein
MMLLTAGLAAFFLSAAVAGADPSVTPGWSITGHYLLIEHVKGVDAFDGIDFHPDKTCTVDYDGSNGLAGTYVAGKDGRLSILLDGGLERSYELKRGRMSLVLSGPGQDDLFYALLPNPPVKLAFKDVLGAYYSRNSMGDCATEVTADHRFRLHVHNFLSNGTYSNVNVEGSCTYANGVITYLQERVTGVEQDDLFVKDVVVKHDARGLWVVDPFDDDLLLETPARDVELPPPPPQYSKPAGP